VPLLREHGIDAYGIDPGSRRDKWAEHGLSDRLFSGSGRSLPFADESFDVVFSSGVLEHVGEHLPEGQRGGPCAEYIREVIRVMKPEGRGLIAHPNVMSQDIPDSRVGFVVPADRFMSRVPPRGRPLG